MKETQPYNENSFPWYMVDSKWNAVARDSGYTSWDSDYTFWTLYEENQDTMEQLVFGILIPLTGLPH